jgi:hypothetical protein
MKMNHTQWIGGALGVLLLSTTAHAHFKVLQPASWLKEDSLGGPQKGSPCGPGNTRPFLGDDVQPVPVSDEVTTFHAGETISVQLQETVYHPGYFRIAFAKTRAADATTTDFPNPPLSDPDNCLFDKAAVKTGAHDNVLADGLFMVEEQSAPGRSLMQDVKLPNEPCEDCTLQIVQVMEAHPAQSCFYFHCADIAILPAEGASGSSLAAAADGGASATPVKAATDDGGCAVANAGARSSSAAAWWAMLGMATALYRRAHRSQRRPSMIHTARSPSRQPLRLT